jgi:hypothetical protein
MEIAMAANGSRSQADMMQFPTIASIQKSNGGQ